MNVALLVIMIFYILYYAKTYCDILFIHLVISLNLKNIKTKFQNHHTMACYEQNSVFIWRLFCIYVKYIN